MDKRGCGVSIVVDVRTCCRCDRINDGYRLADGPHRRTRRRCFPVVDLVCVATTAARVDASTRRIVIATHTRQEARFSPGQACFIARVTAAGSWI